ncbi:MAG: amidase [Methanobacteriota archaeon]|nr:MAG: amidase [Euryarchaeota archaeon]
MRIADMLRRGTLTIPEIEAAAADRIYTYNHKLRAMITLNDESRMNSYDLNFILRESPEIARSKRLLGIPTILKDVFLTDDQGTSAGMMKYFGYRSRISAPIVDLIEEEGALIMGKASVPEMAGDVQTYNDIVGICRNPWNLDLTVGGSSGGVAAAISMGFGHFGLGSDLAGSLRIPANFTGTVSLKPTEGRISTIGHFPPIYSERKILEAMEREGVGRPMDLLFRSGYGKSPKDIDIDREDLYFDCLTVGPMTRSVAELDYIVDVLFTPTTEFGSSLPKFSRAKPEKTYKLGITSHFQFLETDRRVSSKVEDFGEKLEKWGNDIEVFDLPKDIYIQFRDGYSWFGNRFMSLCETEFDIHAESLNKKREGREKLNQQFDQFLEPYDFWILPVSPTLPYPHNLEHSPIEINGRPVKYWKATISYTSFLSYSGLPILTIPIGLVNNLPVGVQIVGKRWKDEKLIAFGRYLEHKLGRFPHPPLSDEIPELEEDEFLEDIDSSLFDF